MMIACEIVEQVDSAWRAREVAPDLLLEHLSASSASTFIFADSAVFLSSSHLRHGFLTKYGVPDYFWTDTYQRLNGHFGLEVLNDPAQVNAYSTCFRFLVKQWDESSAVFGSDYMWYEMGFAYHRTSSGMMVMLCLDIPSVMQDTLKHLISSWREIPPATDVHSCIVGEVVQLYDHSVWTLRNVVRGLEKSRDTGLVQEPKFPFLHNIARHIIHSTETLEVAVRTVSQMAANVERIEATVQNLRHRKLDILQHTLSNLQARSQALDARLRNEISLSTFNLVALQDSRANVRISAAVQNDSSAMKTISLITMAFLPATFVSTIFSMSFFSFTPSSQLNDQSWVVSDKLWIYWSFAGPLTLATVMLWYMREGGPGRVSKLFRKLWQSTSS